MSRSGTLLRHKRGSCAAPCPRASCWGLGLDKGVDVAVQRKTPGLELMPSPSACSSSALDQSHLRYHHPCAFGLNGCSKLRGWGALESPPMGNCRKKKPNADPFSLIRRLRSQSTASRRVLTAFKLRIFAQVSPTSLLSCVGLVDRPSPSPPSAERSHGDVARAER